MRKKWLWIGGGLVVGAVLFLVGGISAMANTSGYEAYMTALKNTKAAASVTAVANLTVTDNGTKVFDGKARIELNRKSDSASVAATIGNGTETQNLNVYSQDGKLIFKSSADEVYRVMEHNASGWQHQRMQGDDRLQPPKAAEKVFDALMGNMKELATVEEAADGGKQASLHMTGSQIPVTVNALGTLMVSHLSGDHGWQHSWNDHEHQDKAPFFAESHPKPNLPQLVDDIKVETVNLDADINPENQLTGQTAEIHISGKDDAGKLHALVIRLDAAFSDLNRTTPDRIDLAGKITSEIRNGRHNWGWHH
jgi:hypothetical protein